MKEEFAFPTTAGMPTGAETVQVTPRFSVDRTEDAVRLTGIYHIAANVTLNKEEARTVNIETAILIDDVDLEGEAGYFEYAVPFSVDLPPEIKDPLNVVTANPVCELSGQGRFAIAWDVECSYQEQKLAQGEALEEKSKRAEKVEESIIENKSVKAATSNNAEKAEVSKVEKAEKETKAKVVDNSIKGEQADKLVKVEKEPSATAVVPSAETPKVEEAVVAIKEAEEVPTAVAVAEETTFSDEDEAISFLAGLEDGISVTSFRIK